MICFQNFRCQSQTGSRWQRGQGGQICLQTISCNSNSGTVHRFSAIPCRKHTKTHVHKLLILFPSMCREHWLTCHIWTSNGCWELDSAPFAGSPFPPDLIIEVVIQQLPWFQPCKGHVLLQRRYLLSPWKVLSSNDGWTSSMRKTWENMGTFSIHWGFNQLHTSNEFGIFSSHVWKGFVRLKFQAS